MKLDRQFEKIGKKEIVEWEKKPPNREGERPKSDKSSGQGKETARGAPIKEKRRQSKGGKSDPEWKLARSGGKSCIWALRTSSGRRGETERVW